jgi:dolichol kinase
VVVVSYPVSICDLCGGVVGEKEKHRKFHDSLVLAGTTVVSLVGVTTLQSLHPTYLLVKERSDD